MTQGRQTQAKDRDHVDRLRQQWRDIRPDIDTSPMEVIGRINRLALLFSKPIATEMLAQGIERGEFDVVGTLRRSGPPHELSPTQLYQDLMLSSGGLTNRLKRLTDKGLITRRPNPDDGRSDLVCLTQTGIALADQVFQADMHIEAGLISDLDQDQRQALAKLLRQLCHIIEGDA